MSKANNLTDFLTDIADTIRTNDGTTAKINPQDFSSRIALETKTATPSATEQTIKPSAGKYGLKSVTVSGDSNLIASNIRTGKSIFGVTGTYVGVVTDTSGLASTIELSADDGSEYYFDNCDVTDLVSSTEDPIILNYPSTLTLYNESGDGLSSFAIQPMIGKTTQVQILYDGDSVEYEDSVQTVQETYNDNTWDEGGVYPNGTYNILLRNDNGETILGFTICGLFPGTLCAYSSTTWSKSNAYLSLKAPVTCRCFMMNATYTSTGYYKHTSCGASSNVYIGQQLISSSYPYTSINLGGTFTKGTILNFYAGTSSTVGTTNNLQIKIPIGCKMIHIRVYYSTSSSCNVSAFFFA